MARPKKTGLDYFPLDCQMDDKVEMLEAEHGLEGFAVYLKLLQHIYQTEAGELDMSVVFRWKTLAKQWGIPAENFRKIVDTMLEVSLFDKTAFDERQVLTSNGIQKRLNEVAALRDRDRRRKTEGEPGFSAGKPTEKYIKGKGKDTNVSQKEKENSLRSSGEGEPEKKIEASPPDPLPAQRPAAHTRGAAGTYREYDEPWPEQLNPLFETPAFHAAWAKWGKYLAEIGKPHRGAIHEDEDLLELRRMAGGDHARALEIIAKSISAGWKRLIDHKETPLHASSTNRRNHAHAGAASGGADPNARHNLPGRVSFAGDAA